MCIHFTKIQKPNDGSDRELMEYAVNVAAYRQRADEVRARRTPPYIL
jgi:hypothetical protein